MPRVLVRAPRPSAVVSICGLLRCRWPCAGLAAWLPHIELMSRCRATFDSDPARVVEGFMSVRLSRRYVRERQNLRVHGACMVGQSMIVCDYGQPASVTAELGRAPASGLQVVDQKRPPALIPIIDVKQPRTIVYFGGGCAQLAGAVVCRRRPKLGDLGALSLVCTRAVPGRATRQPRRSPGARGRSRRLRCQPVHDRCLRKIGPFSQTYTT